MIEEIRKRIKARKDNTDAAGDYDEYADGQGVGLAAALCIIDEVEKEHPIPEDVQEAALNYERSLDYYHFTNDEPGIAYAAGMLAERERMMKDAVDGFVGVHLHDKTADVTVNIGYLPKSMGIKGTDKVRVIIIKKMKNKK